MCSICKFLTCFAEISLYIGSYIDYKKKEK